MSDGKLYWNKVCPFVQRAWIVALEKGVNLEYIHIDLGDKKPAWYTKDVNPRGTVPCLQTSSGAMLFESSIVAEYFDANFGQKNDLLTADPVTRARIQVFMGNCGDLISALYKFLMDNSDEKRTAVKEHLEWIGEQVAKSNGGNGPYFLGDKFSMADVQIVPFLMRFSATLRAYSDFDIFVEAPWTKKMVDAAKLRPSVAGSYCSDEYFVSAYKLYAKRDGTWATPTLYVNKSCPFAQKTILTWAALGLEGKVELKEVSFPLSKEFEQINPAGTVPALVTARGELVQESNVIVRYLAESLNGGYDIANGAANGFIPADAVQEAHAKLVQNDVSGFVSGMFKFLKATGDDQKALQAELKGDGDWIENLYAEGAKLSKTTGPYLYGENVSFADVTLLPFLVRLDATLAELGGGYDFFGEHPRLAALLGAARQNKNLSSAIEPADFYLNGLKSYLKGE